MGDDAGILSAAAYTPSDSGYLCGSGRIRRQRSTPLCAPIEPSIDVDRRMAGLTRTRPGPVIQSAAVSSGASWRSEPR